MKTRTVSQAYVSLVAISFSALLIAPARAQDESKPPATDPAIQTPQTTLPGDQPKITSAAVAAPTAPTGLGTATRTQPDEAEMMKQMMELAKTNENHKLLASLAGTWTYTVKMWMAPGAPPMESTGSGTRKPLMDGRYFQVDHTGHMKMPGPDGKLRDFEFKGFAIEGFDNVKKKFVSTWCDNMGTGILMSEGDYDPATKTFTYAFEMEMVPGMKTKGHEIVKLVDMDHHTFEWYETRGAQEVKTMEINYTRKK